MSNIMSFTLQEMIDDYYESKLEADACEKLLLLGEDARLRCRLNVNRQIMSAIDDEFVRRGEERPWANNAKEV